METNGGYLAGDRSIISGVRIAPPQGYALSGKIMLSAIVVLFAVVILILFLHLYVRWHVLRLASRRRHGGLPLIFAAGVEAPAGGLDPAVLSSLPVLVYTADESKDGGEEAVAECAVCINEFEEGEKMRRLPRCGHRFHIECIDMWFHSHATCPLCRSPVEPPPPTAAVHADVSVADAAPVGDMCFYCAAEGEIGTSSSASGELELRGYDEEVRLTGGMKSPAGRIRAIRRFLSMDLSLYRSEMEAAEVMATDIENGAAGHPMPPRHQRSSRSEWR